jgi:hypothetical protein
VLEWDVMVQPASRMLVTIPRMANPPSTKELISIIVFTSSPVK